MCGIMDPGTPLNYATPLENPDVAHLRLLMIFHYIAAGLVALFGFVPIIYIVMGILVLSGKFPPSPPNGQGMPRETGYIFIALGIFLFVLAWTMAVLLFLSARYMSARRHRIFSIVIACLSCMSFPFGTILGVFTLIVLVRPSVKFLYGE
jgi:hypothetical protein